MDLVFDRLPSLSRSGLKGEEENADCSRTYASARRSLKFSWNKIDVLTCVEMSDGDTLGSDVDLVRIGWSMHPSLAP